MSRDPYAAGATKVLNEIPTKEERRRFKEAFFETLREHMNDPQTRQALISDLAAYGEDAREAPSRGIKYAIYVDIGDLPPREAMEYVKKTRDQLKIKDAVYLPTRTGAGSRVEKFDDNETTPQERAWELFRNILPMDWNSPPRAYGNEPSVDAKGLEPEEIDEMMDWAIRTTRQWDEKMTAFLGTTLDPKKEEGR